MHVRRAAFLLLAAILAVTVAAVAPTTATAAPYSSSSYAARLLALVNAARQHQGLRPLTPAVGTTSVATAWTQHLADAGVLSHNPALAHQLATHGSSDWHTYGENVGEGSPGDPYDLFRAYMNSPEHRANILDEDYRYVGVAVTFGGGLAWNTFDFVDSYGTAHPAYQRPAHHRTVHDRAVHYRAVQYRTPRRETGPAAAPRPRPVSASSHPAVAKPNVTHRVEQHRSKPPAATVEALRRPLSPVPVPSRRRAVLVAIAAVALAAAGRRWTLSIGAAT